jgi:hypothetical protein
LQRPIADVDPNADKTVVDGEDARISVYVGCFARGEGNYYRGTVAGVLGC